MYLDNKNTSNSCKDIKNSIVISKNMIMILILFVLIFNFLFLFSSTNSKIEVRIQDKLINNNLIIPAIINNNFDNYTIDNDITNEIYNKWYIDSIELYLLSTMSIYDENEIILNYIYNNSIKDETLLLKFYSSNSQNFNENGLNFFTNINECPSEYVLSYMKITIKNININDNISIDFYKFFNNEKNIYTRNNIVTLLNINNLYVDNSVYNDWYNWKYNNGNIPNDYPFKINIKINSYIVARNIFDDNNYLYFVW